MTKPTHTPKPETAKQDNEAEAVTEQQEAEDDEEEMIEELVGAISR